jgi:hypothetical protein
MSETQSDILWGAEAIGREANIVDKNGKVKLHKTCSKPATCRARKLDAYGFQAVARSAAPSPPKSRWE